MRGNVGFPPEAIGRVHLRAGEGITGFAAERMRPVSVAVGKQDQHFKYISGLGEEKYPGAAGGADPARPASTAGVLVLQRGRRARVLRRRGGAGDRARRRHQPRHRARPRSASAARRGSADRRAVRLSGQSIVRRRRDGTRRAAAHAVGADAAASRASAPPRARSRRRSSACRTSCARRPRTRTPSAASELRGLSLILEDWRFRARAGRGLRRAGAAQGAVGAGPLVRARRVHGAGQRPRRRGDHQRSRRRDRRPVRVRLRRVAARAPARPLGRHRRRRTAASVRRDSRHHGGRGRVRRRRRDARGQRRRPRWSASAGLPLLASVGGVFSWLQPEDLLVVEAGGLRINPPATAIAHFRNARK